MIGVVYKEVCGMIDRGFKFEEIVSALMINHGYEKYHAESVVDGILARELTG